MIVEGVWYYCAWCGAGLVKKKHVKCKACKEKPVNIRTQTIKKILDGRV